MTDRQKRWQHLVGVISNAGGLSVGRSVQTQVHQLQASVHQLCAACSATQEQEWVVVCASQRGWPPGL